MKFDLEIRGEPVTVYALELPPADWPHGEKILGLDCETTAITDQGVFEKGARVRLVQFGTRDEAYVLDWEDEAQRQTIVRLLHRSVGQEVSFTNYDALWMMREADYELGERYLDAHVLACNIAPGERNDHSLKGLCTVHIDAGLQQAETDLLAEFKRLAPVGHRVGDKLKTWAWNNIPKDNELYLKYAGLDAIYVRRLWDELRRQIRPQAHISVQDLRIKRWMTQRQYAGMRLDVPYTKGLLADLLVEFDTALDWFTDNLGFSGRSPKLPVWLEENGVTGRQWKRTAKGALQLDKKALPGLLERYGEDETLGPVLAQKLTISELSNTVSNLRIALKTADDDGYVHPQINILAAETARMSVVRPAMQTLAKENQRLRRCYLARPGHVLISCDWTGQEVVIQAGYSGDPELLRVVNEGISIPKRLSEQVFGVNYTKDENRRAKAIVYGTGYGAGVTTLVRQTGLTEREVKRIRDTYTSTYAQFFSYARSLQELTVIVTEYGRILPADPDKGYRSINTLVQGTGRDVLGIAIENLYDAGYGDWCWLPVHDEIILEVPLDRVEEGCHAVEEAMNMDFRGVPLRAEAEILGTSWGKLPEETT